MTVTRTVCDRASSRRTLAPPLAGLGRIWPSAISARVAGEPSARAGSAGSAGDEEVTVKLWVLFVVPPTLVTAIGPDLALEGMETRRRVSACTRKGSSVLIAAMQF